MNFHWESIRNNEFHDLPMLFCFWNLGSWANTAQSSVQAYVGVGRRAHLRLAGRMEFLRGMQYERMVGQHKSFFIFCMHRSHFGVQHPNAGDSPETWAAQQCRGGREALDRCSGLWTDRVWTVRRLELRSHAHVFWVDTEYIYVSSLLEMR